MIVRLTARQLDAFTDALETTSAALFEWFLLVARCDEVRKKVEVLLPVPDGWRDSADAIVKRRFTTGSIRKASPPLFDGVRRVLKACNARQSHPAFIEEIVLGRQVAVLPCWRSNLSGHLSPWIPSHDVIGSEWTLRELWPRGSAGGTTRWIDEEPTYGTVMGYDLYRSVTSPTP